MALCLAISASPKSDINASSPLRWTFGKIFQELALIFRLLFKSVNRICRLNFMPLPYSWYQLVTHSICIFFVAGELGLQGLVFKKSAEDEEEYYQ
jgi:hypothetical protein